MQRGGIVYLVGAGPGDPGLITVRGAELLSRADVVLHDRLIDPALLELAPQAQVVDVGKRSGRAEEIQRRAGELMVEHARAGRVVVRLKGGDPFVFGRGGEEAELLARAGVRFEVVPGVTSAVAAPAYAGIPLTHRGRASWVALATGRQGSGEDDGGIDWDALARAPTAVFLMAVERLAEVCARLIEAGRAPDDPAAIVSSATRPGQRSVRARMGDIAEAAGREGIRPPAVLVVGAVAELSAELDWLSARPLLGRRVFVTRTRERAGRLAGALAEAGAHPLVFPAIRIEPPEPPDALSPAIDELPSADWVVFTSVTAVEAFWERLAARGLDTRSVGARVAAAGPSTAQALRDRGIVADLVPASGTAGDAAGLARGLGAGDGRAVVVPQAAGAPDDLVDALSAAGWRCVRADAYRTVRDESSVEAGRAALEDGIDAVLFTSGSTVRSFVELWGPPPAEAIVVCIGPRTRDAARDAGLRVDEVAERPSVEGLVSALIAAVGRLST